VINNQSDPCQVPIITALNSLYGELNLHPHGSRKRAMKDYAISKGPVNKGFGGLAATAPDEKNN
jgi:hypothetical protein